MKHIIIVVYAWLLEVYRKPLMLSTATIKILFIPGFHRLRSFNAKARAYGEFIKARKRVPAYNAFLKAVGFSRPTFTGLAPNISEIPTTDKENYVKRYTMEERCVYGRVPASGVVIDESSGSTGTATNWARGAKERKRNARMIRAGMESLMGKQPLFIINAFALGPWATGMNVSMSCIPFSKVKSLGPDKTKIENTIKFFGTAHKYVILGYPPFLKLLVDDSAVAWKDYDVSFIFGGESMSEGMRDYLMTKGIRKIYSSFGASDLELNISTENDFTISVRKLLRTNSELRAKILQHTGALPMVFQFNPADFFIETSDNGEMIVTICRPDYLAPKIRYNIHDRGHVLPLATFRSILKELHIDAAVLPKPTVDLPLLFHYGRADMTISFFGANVSPTDVQETLYNLPSLAEAVTSFCLRVVEDDQGSKRLIISFEMREHWIAPSPDTQHMRCEFFEQLAKTNQDFREAKRMVNNDALLLVEFHAYGTGPFENADLRIKAKYIN